MNQSKICSKCKQDKELSCYSKNKSRVDGLCHYCLDCRRMDDEVRRQRKKAGISLRVKDPELELQRALEKERVCRSCQQVKDITLFAKAKSCINGYQPVCKECYNAKQRERYTEDEREKKRQYVQKTKEQRSRQRKEHRAKNIERLKAKDKVYYTKRDRKKENERNRKYYQRNKEKKADYEKKNRQKIRDRLKNRLQTDPFFRFKWNLRSRTRRAFKKIGSGKPTNCVALMGADFDLVRRHIERQFKKGMTWENYGQWHIDHVIPLATAKTVEEVKALCHYKNLQPLWAEDNQKKSYKIITTQMTIPI